MMSKTADPDYVLAADAALAKYEASETDPSTYWFSLGGDREDARQSAIIRAWQASEGDGGQTDRALHLVSQARYGILDYVRSLKKDRKIGSFQPRYQRDEAGLVMRSKKTGKPLLEYERDLDGIPLRDSSGKPVIAIDTAVIEYEPRTEFCESESEIHREDACASEDRIAIRSMLDTMLAGVLEDRERQVVAMSFGYDGPKRTQPQIADALGVSERTVRQDFKTAMTKLRAEAQADRIMDL